MSAGRGLIVNDADWAGSLSTLRADTSPDTLTWARRHRRLEGRPFSLERFRPLLGLYEDDAKHICVIKPAQRGVSEWAINVAFFALTRGASAWRTGKDGLNVAYCFPSQSALGDFSKERISGLGRESPYLRDALSGRNSPEDEERFSGVTFKKIGNSYLYLRGAWSELGLLSFACDLLVLDEYDRMNRRAVELLRQRMGASPLQREIDLSTPTNHGRGIHELYLQSDRREYEQPCPRCAAAVVYDFHRDVRVDGEPFDLWSQLTEAQVRRAAATLTCPACGGEVSDEERCAPGIWVARDPEIAGLHGYKIPPLAFPMANLHEFAVAAVSRNPDTRTEFFRSKLGEPYDEGGTRVTLAMLAQLSTDLPGGELPHGWRWRQTTMGVDVGARLHYRVSSTGPDGERYVRDVGSVHGFEDLSRLMLRYQVRQAVIDAQPETRGALAWVRSFPGRALVAYYPDSELKGQPFRVSPTKALVDISRTVALDDVYEGIAAGDEHWPESLHRLPEVRRHLLAPIRTETELPNGEKRAVWENSGPDHTFHACAYDRIAHAVLLAQRRTGGARVGAAQGVARGALAVKG